MSKEASQEDQRLLNELRALNKVIRLLLSLPREARPRIMRYLISRYGT